MPGAQPLVRGLWPDRAISGRIASCLARSGRLVVVAALERLDGVEPIAVVAPQLHGGDVALAGEPVDVRRRHLPALGELFGGQELAGHDAPPGSYRCVPFAPRPGIAPT